MTDSNEQKPEINLKIDFLELMRITPQEIEIEGGGSTWWYVCPECHGTIDQGDHFCRHCGQALKN